jgi:hypothetical protein
MGLEAISDYIETYSSFTRAFYKID